MLKDLDLILSYTSKVGDCLVWSRCFNTDGYPRAVIEGDNNAKVHRVVYELVNKESPPVVRHTCDNPKCINPNHLVGGTNEDNVRDRVVRGRCHRKVLKLEALAVYILRKDGETHKSIAIKLGIKPKRVEYILNKLKKIGKSRGRVVKFVV